MIHPSINIIWYNALADTSSPSYIECTTTAGSATTTSMIMTMRYPLVTIAGWTSSRPPRYPSAVKYHWLWGLYCLKQTEWACLPLIDAMIAPWWPSFNAAASDGWRPDMESTKIEGPCLYVASALGSSANFVIKSTMGVETERCLYLSGITCDLDCFIAALSRASRAVACPSVFGYPATSVPLALTVLNFIAACWSNSITVLGGIYRVDIAVIRFCTSWLRSSPMVYFSMVGSIKGRIEAI